jgi:IS5 family transposase
MLRDRYDACNVFDQVPTLSQAMEPVLVHLDRLLEADTLFQTVRQDLVRRFPRTATTGRHSTPVEVILRLLVIKHLYSWSYEQTERFVADSLVLRQFCRVYWQPVPDDTTLLRWANLIQPETLQHLLEPIVDLARKHKVTRGRKLRLDATVVETNIHYPTDSGLLGDGVRVLGRLLKKARTVLPQAPKTLFRNRVRSARRQVKQIADITRRRMRAGKQAADAALRTTYGRLVAVAEATRRQAQKVGCLLQQARQRCAHPHTGVLARLAQTLQTVGQQVSQALAQTVTRVFAGQNVPAEQKSVSLFEPHTAVIRKGKPSRPVEFGRVVWLDEVDGGLISRFSVLDGNPPEAEQVPLSLDHHRARFGHPPRLLAGDRGTYSPTGEQYAADQGVRQVVLPKPGAKSASRSAYERQRWFRRGHNWRAGMEARISLLKRRYGLRRCLYHGDAGMQRWVGWGVIAYDLQAIAQFQAQRSQ